MGIINFSYFYQIFKPRPESKMFFEQKFEEQKESLYLQYLVLLKNNNKDLQSDISTICNKDENLLTKFIKNFYLIQDIDYGEEVYCQTEETKEKEIINQSNYENGIENFSIVLFDCFPVELVEQIIQLFIDNRIYNHYVYPEVKKYLYLHWKDNKVPNQVKQITNILIETANFTKEEYADIITNFENPRYNKNKHYVYYVFWLYCFYPLVENYEELLLKLVNLVHLEDAQDELMDGLFRIESKKLLPFYKKFLIAVWKSNNYRNDQCFDLFSYGTGAIQENAQIMKKLKDELGWDVFNEPELKEFWNDKENSNQISKLIEIMKK